MIYVSKYILHRFRIVCPVIAYHINVDDFVSFREMFLVSQQQQQDRIQYIYRYIYMDESGWEDKYERNNEIRRALILRKWEIYLSSRKRSWSILERETKRASR